MGMELKDAIAISASGMQAQGVRMRVISQNLANADTAPGTPTEEPYRRKVVTFKNTLDKSMGTDKVKVDRVTTDNSSFRTKYDPNHPGANAEGYVQLPNVNPLIEVMDMREAQRSYEANISAIEISRNMMSRTVDLLRGQ